jgi:hypothetical protein
VLSTLWRNIAGLEGCWVTGGGWVVGRSREGDGEGEREREVGDAGSGTVVGGKTDGVGVEE